VPFTSKGSGHECPLYTNAQREPSPASPPDREQWIETAKRAAPSAALGVTLIDRATKLTCHGAALIFRLLNQQSQDVQK